MKSVKFKDERKKEKRKKRRQDAITKDKSRDMVDRTRRNSIPAREDGPSCSLNGRRVCETRGATPLPVHASRIVRRVSSPSPSPAAREIAREINKNPPSPFFLSFFPPRTIRLPSTSGFLARRIYGGRSRARFPSLAEKPAEYLLRRMEKFLPLPLLLPLIRVRGWFSRAGFASPNTNRPNENCLSPPDIVDILLPLLRVTVSNCLFDPRVSFLIRYFSSIHIRSCIP